MCEIKIARSDDEILNCHRIMSQLHDRLQAEDFVDTIRRLEGNGYKLAYLREEQTVYSVTGFQLGESIAWGRHIYVADLVTDTAQRSRGFGQMMIEWILNYAREHDCGQVHLDSRVIRHAAHRFYLNQGFILGGYHFHHMLGSEN